MIEDKELGLQMAESPEEAIWVKFKEAREESIKSLEENLLIERELLKLAESKIKK